MKTMHSWHGTIAQLNTATKDGRLLHPSTTHNHQLPAIIYTRDKHTRQLHNVGLITNLTQDHQNLTASGTIDLELLKSHDADLHHTLTDRKCVGVEIVVSRAETALVGATLEYSNWTVTGAMLTLRPDLPWPGARIHLTTTTCGCATTGFDTGITVTGQGEGPTPQEGDGSG